MKLELSPADRAEIERIGSNMWALAHQGQTPLESAYLAGMRAGIIRCSSLCGWRSQEYDKYSIAPDIVAKRDEAESLATACRALADGKESI